MRAMDLDALELELSETSIHHVVARVPIQEYICPSLKKLQIVGDTIELTAVDPEPDSSVPSLRTYSLCSRRDVPFLSSAYETAQEKISPVTCLDVVPYKGKSHAVKRSSTKASKRFLDKHNWSIPPPSIRINSFRLEIGKQIGVGGYSRCYLATSADGQVEYAVKLVSRGQGEPVQPNPSSSSTLASKRVPKSVLQTLNRIHREAELYRRLHHENIVKFHEIVETKSHVGVVLSYCPNGTLQDLIVKCGPMHEPAACATLGHLFRGIEYSHSRHIHHADLKLSNILSDKQLIPQIADFGFAKQLTSATQTRTHLCGTPAYMAPEISATPCRFGLPSDIWALGAIAYALIKGQSPFNAKTVSNVYARVLSYDVHYEELSDVASKSFIRFIRHMLEPDIELRPTAKCSVKSHRMNVLGLFGGEPGHVIDDEEDSFVRLEKPKLVKRPRSRKLWRRLSRSDLGS